ncbi:MAG: hypothetical protein HN742_04975 [Lentisphaerae bacterium]|jgi:hypothetical protein|nr:hypothetical protein [Lentisphaerota bacterium]MBT4819814.1 hypothetical protein [Lentisphaerota bacterium]MBT5610830.1 hypothetical protein [Lentisphaerota bacterium]MBT7053738.1 hypothetical protein [Lentisphaerota bacterium]MBT7841199.1 hypothetical protein [Lentisphaerota bacterium]
MLILTESGLFANDTGTRELPVARSWLDHARCISEGEQTDAAVASDGEIVLFRGGRELERLVVGIAEPIESVLVCEAPLPCLFLGTEGARLYCLPAGDAGAHPVSSFDDLPCRESWYTPWGGPPAVRSLAAAPDGCIYADVHVGSIMCSSDHGVTWRAATPTLNEDVHEVATCPAAADRVYANTAHAVYISEDRGNSWTYRGEQLGGRYGRAIAVHPRNPARLLATVSDGPHGENVHGQLFVSSDFGLTWQHVEDGFPASTHENIDTFQAAISPDGAGWAAVGRRLYRSPNPHGRWDVFWEAPAKITALSCREMASTDGAAR